MTNANEQLSLKDFYGYTTQQIGAEAALINDRISWMLTFQGFLFASIAIVTGVGTDPILRIFLELIIPTVGMTVGILTLIGVHAAYLSIDNIKQKWENELAGRAFAPAYGTPLASKLGRIPSRGVPITVAIAWLLFLLLTRGG